MLQFQFCMFSSASFSFIFLISLCLCLFLSLLFPSSLRVSSSLFFSPSPCHLFAFAFLSHISALFNQPKSLAPRIQVSFKVSRQIGVTWLGAAKPNQKLHPNEFIISNVLITNKIQTIFAHFTEATIKSRLLQPTAKIHMNVNVSPISIHFKLIVDCVQPFLRSTHGVY